MQFCFVLINFVLSEWWRILWVLEQTSSFCVVGMLLQVLVCVCVCVHHSSNTVHEVGTLHRPNDCC